MKIISAIVLVFGLNCDFETSQGEVLPSKPPIICTCCASPGKCLPAPPPPPPPPPAPAPQPPETPPCNPPKPCEIPK